jgi:DNA-binding GntR family transcriptional regulator
MSLDKLSMNVRENRKSTQELVTDALRNAILNGYYEDGKPIETIDLAEKFGVSRMPIRIALQQLESEGLVELQPHKKAIAVKLSPSEVRKLTDIRCELEVLATRLAVPNITVSDIEKMNKLVEQMDQSIDPQEFISLNMEYHNTIYLRSDNDKLNDLIVQLRNNVERYLKFYLNDRNHFKKANQEHKQILSAIKKKDTTEAEGLIRQHLLSVGGTIAQLLERK